MTAPVQPQFKPADIWESLVDHGLSEKDATRHVMLAIANQPEQIRRQYLKDVDPGKLASFGLGAADMMSFGLGDQAARALLGQEATDTQDAAKANHPTAHLLGEVAGVVGPAAVEYAGAKAGVVVPTALGRAVRAITSKPGRAVARTALRATEGAALAGAQAAGRTEGSIGTRAKAAAQAAPWGAAAGTLLPLATDAAIEALQPLARYAKRVGARVAGEGAAKAAPRAGLLMHTAGDAVSDIAQAQADFAAGRISRADLDAAMDYARLQMRGNEGLLAATPRIQPDALDVPTFQRRPSPPIQNGGLLAPGPASEPLVHGKPGHPVWRGEGSATRSAEVRDYEPLVPSKNELRFPEPSAQASKLLRKQSFAKLQAAIANPETPEGVRDLIRAELQRRGIVMSP